MIDPQMNLVKNGTLTEGCLPFSSGDGITIEPCPTTCKDGSEYKKYYSQNPYITEDYYSSRTFYEIVALIMDQLVTKGPVACGIDVYQDFMNWHYYPEKCHNEVYSYDGTSAYLGGHAVVIVGYGLLNDKYYWLIQNSWGEYACDHGFVKVEFGNIGVEAVAFSDPYLHKEIEDPINIEIAFDSMDEECTLQVTTNASLDDWVNTLDIGFKNTQTDRPFNFQCSSVEIPEEKRNVCYFEYFNFWAPKGIYKYNYHKSLGDENSFTLDSALTSKDFQFFGFDELYPIYTYDIYISQEGSKVVFLYYGEDDEISLPPIYANEYSETPLSDCQYVFLGGDSFISCDIKDFELAYFDEDYNDMVYDIFCGAKEYTYITAYKLDTTKYPVFKINKFILPEKKSLGWDSIFTLKAEVEGSVSEYDSYEDYFVSFIDVEFEKRNYTTLIFCILDHPGKPRKDYSFYCELLDDSEEIPYDNVYLHPYNFPYFNIVPYEVYIKDIIKGESPALTIPKIQVYIESLCPDCVNFITKSFKDFHEKVQNPNLAEIEFIPFGNAKEAFNETTNLYDFECQHGENECYGNLIETCAIQVMGRIRSYEVILCIETNIAGFKRDFDNTLAYCLADDEALLEEVKSCVDSDMGNYYEHQMAQKTSSEHKWVPWVVVNGVHDQDAEDQIIKSLTDYLCGDDKTKCYSN